MLKNLVEDAKQKSQDLKKSVDELEKRIARLEDLIQPNFIHQMATDCEKTAMEVIFPLCRKKPYYLRSYSNLLMFLSEPDSDKFTGPFAPAAWMQLPEEERAAITTRAKQFVASNQDLKVAIWTLRSAAWKHTRSTRTVEETLNVYKQLGDDETCEAITVCAVFLGWTPSKAIEP